ncbi:MAG: phytoene desaturase [Fluviicola sp.]|nr:phytoene desaturase [Fluviicola sp.]
MKKKAVVVGAGIAGLAGSIRLAVKGYEVHCFDANPYPGGKLTIFNLGDYRFDAGPSLFTMPQFVEELFLLAGKKPSEHFDYIKHPTACHYFFEDGTFLRFPSDKQALFNEVKSVLNIDTKPLEKHIERSKLIYDATHKAFLERSLHRFSSYISTDILNCVAHIPWLNIFTTMHAANEARLNHPKLVQIFDRYATYNGSNPYMAPGILNIIPHLEFGIGTFFPTKGMHSITTSLVQLAEELGVQFHLGQRVEEIIVENKEVKGIRTKAGEILADVVLCNSDVKPAYRKLMPKVEAPKKTMAQEPSSSAMIFYWGVKKSFPNLDLHNIFFSEDYKNEFKTIFEDLTVCEDPTVYIHISSKVVKTDAPEGSEAWFVMVNVPCNQGQDWEALRPIIRQRIITKLNRLLNIHLESLIEEEDYLDPLRIEARTSSFGGALYGASSNDRMAAFFRHPNFSKVKGLYFAGGSVHPGGGIPLCLLSAKIASELIPDASNN